MVDLIGAALDTREAYPRANGPSVWQPIGELAKEYSVGGERHTWDAVSDVVETRSSAPPTGELRRAMDHIVADTMRNSSRWHEEFPGHWRACRC
jgi:hypothetical protein